MIEQLEPGDPRLLTDVLPVLAELRPHLDAASFERIYRDGYGQGLRFTVAWDDAGACAGVAGWRLVATTNVGLKLYVDDLVTTSSTRSAGVGRSLLSHLESEARAAGCKTLELDSGTHRVDAHRFYFRERMAVTAFHFSKPL